MYTASISTIKILKIYGVLKYIANISELTALARHWLGSCFLKVVTSSAHMFVRVCVCVCVWWATIGSTAFFY